MSTMLWRRRWRLQDTTNQSQGRLLNSTAYTYMYIWKFPVRIERRSCHRWKGLKRYFGWLPPWFWLNKWCVCHVSEGFDGGRHDGSFDGGHSTKERVRGDEEGWRRLTTVDVVRKKNSAFVRQIFVYMRTKVNPLTSFAKLLPWVLPAMMSCNMIDWPGRSYPDHDRKPLQSLVDLRWPKQQSLPVHRQVFCLL